MAAPSLFSAMMSHAGAINTRPKHVGQREDLLVKVWPERLWTQGPLAEGEVGSRAGRPLTELTKLTYLTGFLARASTSFDNQRDEAVHWLASILELAYPGITNDLGLAEKYNIVWCEISWRELLKADRLIDDDEQPLAPESEPGFPTAIGTYDELANAATMEAVYGIISMWAWTMSKTIGKLNVNAFTLNRPNAIIGKYHIPETARGLLTGDYKPHYDSWAVIHTIWTTQPALRQRYCEEFATWTIEETPSRSHDIMATTFRLVSWSGLTHVSITNDFLEAFPQATQLDLLRPYIKRHHDALVQLRQLTTVMRPYAKVYYGDQLGFFRQKDQTPLTQVARAVMRLTQPTLENYYADPAYAPFVQTVLRALNIAPAAPVVPAAQE